MHAVTKIVDFKFYIIQKSKRHN